MKIRLVDHVIVGTIIFIGIYFGLRENNWMIGVFILLAYFLYDFVSFCNEFMKIKRSLIFALWKKGLVSDKTCVESFGLDYEEEQRLLKEERKLYKKKRKTK